jgi:hypothetical protein
MKTPSRLVQATSAAFLTLLVAVAPSHPGLESSSRSAYAATRGGKGKLTTKDFEYQVSDCLESDRTNAMKLVVAEDSVSFNQVLKMNCIAATRPSTVKVTYARKGKALEVGVVLSSDVLSDCTCPIGIDGTISNLGKGTYRISFFYEAKDDPAHAKPTRQALGTKDFTIE